MSRTKIVAVTAIVALVLSVAGAAAFGASSASAAPKPFAVGAGGVGVGDQFSFSAHDGPNGPSGFARIDAPTFGIQGPVVCFVQTGPNAVKFSISAKKVSENAATQNWTGLLFHVTDIGSPGSVGDLIGTGVFNSGSSLGSDPTNCDQAQGQDHSYEREHRRQIAATGISSAGATAAAGMNLTGTSTSKVCWQAEYFR